MALDLDPASPVGARVAWGVVAVLAALSIGLWWRFGPVVFVDMVASAWRFCF